MCDFSLFPKINRSFNRRHFTIYYGVSQWLADYNHSKCDGFVYYNYPFYQKCALSLNKTFLCTSTSVAISLWTQLLNEQRAWWLFGITSYSSRILWARKPRSFLKIFYKLGGNISDCCAWIMDGLIREFFDAHSSKRVSDSHCTASLSVRIIHLSIRGMYNTSKVVRISVWWT